MSGIAVVIAILGIRRSVVHLLLIFVRTWDNQKGEDEAPFRFILNHSKAIAQNVYLMMYPRPALARHLGRSLPTSCCSLGSIERYRSRRSATPWTYLW